MSLATLTLSIFSPSSASAASKHFMISSLISRNTQMKETHRGGLLNSRSTGWKLTRVKCWRMSQLFPLVASSLYFLISITTPWPPYMDSWEFFLSGKPVKCHSLQTFFWRQNGIAAKISDLHHHSTVHHAVGGFQAAMDFGLTGVQVRHAL